MSILITLAAVFILVCSNELFWHHKKSQNEFSRKITHITVGVYAAFWPFYLSFSEVKYLALLGLLVLIFSKYFNVFKSIHNIDRANWGEVCSALSVGILAFLTNNKWLYAASILQMALADGLAAVIGSLYGKRNGYKVFGYTKSVIGSLTFFLTSFVILVVFKEAGHLNLSLPYLGVTSLAATFLENIGVMGLDNLIVPLAVLFLLSR